MLFWQPHRNNKRLYGIVTVSPGESFPRIKSMVSSSPFLSFPPVPSSAGSFRFSLALTSHWSISPLSSSSFLSSLLIPFLPLVLKSCLIAYLNRLLSHSVEQKRLTWIETQGLCQAQWCSLSAVKMVFNNVLAFVVIPAKLQDSPSTILLG